MSRPLLFLSLVFAVLAFVPSGAHLAELWNKISLPGNGYLVVQQIYAGWALFGFVVVPGLALTGALAFSLRGEPAFKYALAAFLCIVATQVVFWTFTFPANQATSNWTVLPQGWEALRARWEYSHAASAVLNFVAVLTLCAVATGRTAAH